jgi:hypothetical protein
LDGKVIEKKISHKNSATYENLPCDEGQQNQFGDKVRKNAF